MPLKLQPLNVKADSDEDRGSVGYGKLMPNEVKQPELTKTILLIFC